MQYQSATELDPQQLEELVARMSQLLERGPHCEGRPVLLGLFRQVELVLSPWPTPGQHAGGRRGSVRGVPANREPDLATSAPPTRGSHPQEPDQPDRGDPEPLRTRGRHPRPHRQPCKHRKQQLLGKATLPVPVRPGRLRPGRDHARRLRSRARRLP